MLRKHIKEFYLLYIFAIIFTVFSMASQLPYLEMNYDDPFYLGSIVRSIGSSSLGMIDFQTGSSSPLDFFRTLNTFHLNYAYYSELFKIDAVFFSRCVMTFHNYFIVFLTFMMFFSRFIKREDHNQYVIVVLALLLIPAGYLESHNLARIYDGWQFNTAIWYGGSIVRLSSLPILLLIGFEMVTKITLKKFIFYMICVLALLSLSTIVIPFAFFTSLILFYSFMIQKVRFAKEFWKKLFVWFFIIVTMLGVMVLPKIISHLIPSYGAQLQTAFEAFKPFRILYTEHNYILYIGVIALLITIVIYRDYMKRMFFAQTLFISFICFTALYDKFIIIVSMGYFFVGLRLLAGTTVLLFCFCGLLFVNVLGRVNKKYILPVIGIASIVCVTIFNIRHLETYKSIDYLGSGLVKQGYDFNRLFSKDNVKPSIISKLQNYFSSEFDTMKKVIAPHVIEWNSEELLLTAQLSVVDINLENCSYLEGCKLENEERTTLDEFLINDISYEAVAPLFKKYQIQYAIVSKHKYDQNLQSDNIEIALEMQDDNGLIYYLIKL